jgi:hypothetical protein
VIDRFKSKKEMTVVLVDTCGVHSVQCVAGHRDYALAHRMLTSGSACGGWGTQVNALAALVNDGAVFM